VINRYFRALFVGFLTIVFLSGCSSIAKGPFYSEEEVVFAPEDKAAVYVYRMDKNYAKAVTFKIFVDDEVVSKLGNSSYFVVPVEPGERVFATKTATYGDEPITIDVKAGSTRFLRLDVVSKAMGFAADLSFEEVTDELATLEMTSCRRETDRYAGPEI